MKDGSLAVTRGNGVTVCQWTTSTFSLNKRGGTTVAGSAQKIVFYADDSIAASIRPNKRFPGQVATSVIKD